MLLALVLAAAPTTCTHAWDCTWNDATKTCEVRTIPTQTPGGASIPGPTCACEAGACVAFTVEAVRCTTTSQCGIDNAPFPHATSSTKNPRPTKGKFKPCKDGEVDSVCDAKTKTCTLVHWKC